MYSFSFNFSQLFRITLTILINMCHKLSICLVFPALKFPHPRWSAISLGALATYGVRSIPSIPPPSGFIHSFNFECCANMKVAKFSHLVVMAVTVCQQLLLLCHALQPICPAFHRFTHFPIASSLIARHILVPVGVERNCDWSVGLLFCWSDGKNKKKQKTKQNYELLALFLSPVLISGLRVLVPASLLIATPQWSMLGF